MSEYETPVHRRLYRHSGNDVCCNLAVYSFHPHGYNREGSISIVICERRPAAAHRPPNVYYLKVHLPSAAVPDADPDADLSLCNVQFEISRFTRQAASVLPGDMQEFLNVKLAHLYSCFGFQMAMNARVDVVHSGYAMEIDDERLLLEGCDGVMMDQEMMSGEISGMPTGMMLRVGEMRMRDFAAASACAACRRGVERSEQMKMSCGHHFHYHCFVETLIAMNRNRCPACRSNLVPIRW